jgi:hypothetical protein
MTRCLASALRPCSAALRFSASTTSRRTEALHEPESREDEQRSDDSGRDISERDGDFVEFLEKAQQAEQQAADESARQAQPEISQRAKAFAFPFYYQPGEAAAEQTNDYPDD